MCCKPQGKDDARPVVGWRRSSPRAVPPRSSATEAVRRKMFPSVPAASRAARAATVEPARVIGTAHGRTAGHGLEAAAGHRRITQRAG